MAWCRVASVSWNILLRTASGTLEFAEIIEHLDPEGKNLVTRARDYALVKHAGQKRLSGDPYIVHLMAVAEILAQHKLDAPTLATVFLHDVLEEGTTATLEEVQELFGSEVGRLVDGVTKLTGLFSRQEKEVRRTAVVAHSNQEAAIENLRRIFIAMASDLRVILVKLADRLHNLRTLQYTAPAVQSSIAWETLDIFAPIASRLGIWEFKAELEDLSFKYAYPQEYVNLVAQLETNRQQRQLVMDEVVSVLQKKLDELGIKAELEHRSKHLYSIFKKTVRTGKTLDEIFDLTAVRIIVNTIEECYSMFGIVHSLWSPMSGRIKDYIARPKPNNYRSLHTTVIGPRGQALEVQIRTFEMHRVNEVGIAAHWAYKEGRKGASRGRDSQAFAEIYPWIRALLDWHGDAREDYADHLKLDLLSQEVFVFTPRGDVIDLPAGSTPIDFAYRIHTEVGHRCVGAVVNNKMVPLTYKLVNADVVDIQTAKNGTPSRDWLRICPSHQALAKIRAWFKKERREENIVRGKEMLRRELVRSKWESLLGDDELMGQVATALSFVTVDDLIASVGYGETSPAQITGRAQSLKAASAPQVTIATMVPLEAKTIHTKGNKQQIVVKGMSSILTKLARCCAPVPGDEISGYISVGSGVSVHRTDCSNMANLVARHPERIIEVAWNTDSADEAAHYLVNIEVCAWDRAGLVSDVMSVLNDSRVPVKACKAWAENDHGFINLGIEVAGREHMEEIVRKIKKVKNVSGVRRLVNS